MAKKHKTTLMLDEELYRQIRIRAAESGTSISSVVAEATTAYLTKRPGKKIELPAFGEGGWVDPRFEKMSYGQLLEELEGPLHR